MGNEKEIARQGFVHLERDNHGMYLVLNDGDNFLATFYAETETKAKQIFKAWLAGGARERYAVENGNASIDEDVMEFTYSDSDPYQDANGATYSLKRNEWVG